jgi:hypothetical protein
LNRFHLIINNVDPHASATDGQTIFGLFVDASTSVTVSLTMPNLTDSIISWIDTLLWEFIITVESLVTYLDATCMNWNDFSVKSMFILFVKHYVYMIAVDIPPSMVSNIEASEGSIVPSDFAARSTKVCRLYMTIHLPIDHMFSDHLLTLDDNVVSVVVLRQMMHMNHIVLKLKPIRIRQPTTISETSKRQRLED